MTRPNASDEGTMRDDGNEPPLTSTDRLPEGHWLELVELNLKALPDRTHPCVANERHVVPPTVPQCLERCEIRIMRHGVGHVKSNVPECTLFGTRRWGLASG